MAAFNVESEFLDLKKIYQHFEYASLINYRDSRDKQGHEGNEGKEADAYEGMTQNTYLFVQEKQTLIQDTENISLYFRHKHCGPVPSMNE